MAERTRIVAELKRALRAGGHTYADVARRLDLSVASVKRLFSQQDLTLERIDCICDLVGMSLSEILSRAEARSAPVRQLTLAQESQIVADSRLLFMAWLVLIRTPFEEIVRDYRFDEHEALRYLIRLDRLKVIELQPGNRVRLLISRHFSWRPGGPVQRYIAETVLPEFLIGRFDGPEEEFTLHGGRVSRTALGEIRRVLQDAARECAAVIERDRSASRERVGAVWLLALRPFTHRHFRQFDRSVPQDS